MHQSQRLSGCESKGLCQVRAAHCPRLQEATAAISPHRSPGWVTLHLTLSAPGLSGVHLSGVRSKAKLQRPTRGLFHNRISYPHWYLLGSPPCTQVLDPENQTQPETALRYQHHGEGGAAGTTNPTGPRHGSSPPDNRGAGWGGGREARTVKCLRGEPLGLSPGTGDRKRTVPTWTSRLLPASDGFGFSLLPLDPTISKGIVGWWL